LRRKIEELNLRTIAEITNATKAGGACMSCHHAPGGLQDLLDDVWGKGGKQLRVIPTHGGVRVAGGGERDTDNLSLSPPATHHPAPAEPAVSPFQFMKRVEKTLAEVVQPMLARDGGAVEIVDIKDNLIFCKLEGACAGCASAGQTLKLMVEKTLKDLVDERIRVVQV
jgi:Fe-S cluster biogenesis protein NfuA